jgi:nucleotide-binding universal stress UspA family protein
MSDEAPEQPAGDSGQRCLVVGYDRSESARRAIAWAVSDLLPDGKLVIVHGCRPLHAPTSPISSAEERLQVGRAIVDELLLESEDRLRDLDLATEILDSDPVSALIEASERHGANAIVVGSERHSRLRRALGVVTSELLQSSPVPVIVVPESAATA